MLARASAAPANRSAGGGRQLPLPGEGTGKASDASPSPPAHLPPILCYHKIERRRELGVTRISPRRFARQIERLRDAGWRTLTLAELAACVRGERRVESRELAITFDDAYRGLRDHAFPVLEAHGFSAICFVITEYAGRLNRWDVAYGGRRFAHLAWRDMRRWQERGIDFASHTATHPRLTWVDDGRLGYELASSRAALERALDIRTTALSYPFGACARRERDRAASEGYDVGFTLARGWRGDALLAPRTPVYMWAPPLPAVGLLAPVERFAGAIANRCAVGTTLLTAHRSDSPG
ncbi:MAG TPA: polysaccharide deacetylase family protein [Gemmatimonadaceae bacterium]|nr:polysaccharide deacetylase family protein [Gemmatimonadaceae bacterium]